MAQNDKNSSGLFSSIIAAIIASGGISAGGYHFLGNQKEDVQPVQDRYTGSMANIDWADQHEINNRQDDINREQQDVNEKLKRSVLSLEVESKRNSRAIWNLIQRQREDK